ncbi:tetraspanin-33b [Tachysurus ichikawai]
MDRDLNLNRAETFSYINPWIRYFLFVFSFTFWVFPLCIVATGVYANVQKAADPGRDAFLIGPANILIVVGVVMFFITYCGCNRTLQENIDLLKPFSFSLTLVFFAQLIIAIQEKVEQSGGGKGSLQCLSPLAQPSYQIRDALGKLVKKQLFITMTTWTFKISWITFNKRHVCKYQIQFMCCGWNNYTDWSWNIYFNCSQRNPSKETCAVPFSCCTPVSRENMIKAMCGFGVQTQKHLEDAASIYTEGCSDSAVIWTESHLLLVGTLALGLALPQIAGIVLSQMLVSQINSEINSLL